MKISIPTIPLLIPALLVLSSLFLAACLPGRTPEPAPKSQEAIDFRNSRQEKRPLAETSDINAIGTPGEGGTASTAPSAQTGQYLPYSPATYQAAQQRGDQVVYFFHAAWCPTCKVADQDISSRVDEIPAGVTILKTDYDTENELKDRYGITYQHTFVAVDTAGNVLKKWNGGELDQIISNVSSL